MKKLTILVTVSAVALLVLAGCGNDGSGSQAADQFNAADVAFAQQMIPHHQQAIAMAKLAKARATSPQVKSLAADIEQAQGPEIQTMTDWLLAWGQDIPDDSSMPGMSSGDMAMDMPGMMSREDMSNLRAASGASFDRMFLTMMIDHHQGAIEMAQTEQTDGQHPDATALAEKIEADQTAEKATMQRLLDG